MESQRIEAAEAGGVLRFAGGPRAARGWTSPPSWGTTRACRAWSGIGRKALSRPRADLLVWRDDAGEDVDMDADPLRLCDARRRARRPASAAARPAAASITDGPNGCKNTHQVWPPAKSGPRYRRRKLYGRKVDPSFATPRRTQ